MPLPQHRPGWPEWLPWPRRTARARIAALYTGLFLASGAALVTITYALFQRATAFRAPHLPKIPQTAAVLPLQLPQLAEVERQLAQKLAPLALAPPQLGYDQTQLAQVQHSLKAAVSFPGPNGPGLLSMGQVQHELSTAEAQLMLDQRQLARDQHQVASAVGQLARAVHQLEGAAPVQAAQRAADSHQLLVNSGIALAIVAVLALLVGWFAAGRILRPIRVITRTAQRISSANLHERLALHGPEDELKELGDTLDDLFGRLEAAFEAQRHFVANASHELRTPITAERNLLQVALDDPHTSAEEWRSTAHELLASNDEKRHLIEALLTLASSESRLDPPERADLADVCRTVLLRSVHSAERLGLRVETDLRSAPLEGDPRLIERLAANLIDNAIVHNFGGGYLRISSGTTTDGRAVLCVANSGPSIPFGEIGRLFQPFQRLDPHRTHHRDGLGLGLSIVQAVATTHRATVNARPGPGGGLCVTVTFPGAASSPALAGTSGGDWRPSPNPRKRSPRRLALAPPTSSSAP